MNDHASLPSDLPSLPPRPADAHKGTFGYDLVVGGSVGMAGAVVLTSQACLRSGAGVVRTCVPETIYEAVASQMICPLVFPLPDTLDGSFHPDAARKTRSLAAESDAAALGPGIGTQDETVRLVRELLRTVEIPTVLDADGLNIISREVSILSKCDAPLVLTPHPGEFARLTDMEVSEIQSNRSEYARSFADRHNLVVVLKGQRTVVTDGEQSWVNQVGNPGMATGGSGDVLTGIILSLLGQEVSPYNAAKLAVFLHASAGDRAAEAVGEDGLIASDLVEYVPEVMKEFRNQ